MHTWNHSGGNHSSTAAKRTAVLHCDLEIFEKIDPCSDPSNLQCCLLNKVGFRDVETARAAAEMIFQPLPGSLGDGGSVRSRLFFQDGAC